MPISEEDALGALALAEANRNNPAVVLKAKDIAVAYKAQQKAAGLPMFPKQERAREEQYSTIKGFYTDPNHGLDEETLGFVNETLRGSEDSKYKIFNKKYFEFHGIPKDQVDSQADQLINAYGLQEFKKPISTHKEFFDSISADFKAEKQVEDMAREFTLAKMGPLDSETQFRERMASVPGYAGREAKWGQEFFKIKDSFESRLDPHRTTVKLLSASLKQREGVGADTSTIEAATTAREEMLSAPSFEEMTQLVMGVPAEDRKLVIAAAIAESANDEAGRKSVLQGLLESFDRGVEGGIENIKGTASRSVSIAIQRDIENGVEVPVGKEASPEEYLEAVRLRVLGGDAYELRAGVMGVVAGKQFATPSEEVKQQALKFAKDEFEVGELADELRSAAQNQIDPITSDFIAVRGLYSAAQSLPYLATSLAKGGFALNSMALAGDSYRSLRERNPTMTAEQAQTISMIAGPAQAYVEQISGKLLTSRLPAFNRYFNQIIGTKGSIPARFLARTPAILGAEMVQENVQDVTPFVIQGALSAISEDMPNVPVELLYKDMIAQQPELFFAVLPLAIMGGGAGAYSDFRNGRELLSSYDELRAQGVSEAKAAEIRSLAVRGDLDGAQSLLREEFKTLGQDQKSVQEARAEAIPKLVAEYKAQSSALQSGIELDILPAILSQRDGKTALRYNDGTEVSYDTHAEAMQRFEAIASSAVLALHRDSITAARMTTSQMEQGREVKLIISPLDPTTTEMQEQGVASAEQLQKRKEIEEADKGITPKAEEARARALTGMSANSSEARKAASYVLGSSVNAPAAPDSFGDRVIRTTARVYKRGNPYTVIEEIAEGDIKFMITEGRVERSWVISALRQWESQMGDTLFRKSITDDSQVENQDIVEAYSKMVVSYFAGRATAGDQGRIFSKEFRSEIAKALRMDMNSVLTGYASLFEAVYRRAAMIEKARKEKTLPADLESFLSKSAGMSPQKVFEREVVKEGEGIAEEMGVEFVDEETFSTITPAVDAEYLALAADPVKNQARLQEMVDSVAKRLGFIGPYFHGTKSEFSAFSRSSTGQNFKGKRSEDKGWFFFSSLEVIAEQIAEQIKTSRRSKTIDPRPVQVLRVFLKPDQVLTETVSGEPVSHWDNNPFLSYSANVKKKDTVIIKGKSKTDKTGSSPYLTTDSEMVAVKNPNQIKSADPVTYDEQGNVIPLSQRFNPARDEISFSTVTPGVEADPYRDRAGEDAGTPLTETEVQEGIEDESGTVADIEIDDDAFSNKSETTFSVVGAAPFITRASLKGKSKFVYFSDWTRVGTYTGLYNDSGISIPLQGGPYYPYIEANAKAKAGWAFTAEGMFTRFQKRVEDTDGIGLTTLYGKDNLRANPTFLKAYIEELMYALRAGLITEEKMLASINDARSQVVGLSATKTDKKTGKVKVKYTVARDSEAFPLFSKQWESIDDFKVAMETATFEIRAAMFSTSPKTVTKNKVKTKLPGQFSGGRLASQKNVKAGMPDVVAMIDLFADPQFDGGEYGLIIGAVQFEKSQTKSSRAEEIGTDPHLSYPVVIKGTGIGFFSDPIHVTSVIKKPGKKPQEITRSAETSMAGLTFSVIRVTPDNPVLDNIDGIPAAEIFKSAKNRHGVTRSIYEAGYVLPDGTMLDFSGRADAAGFKQLPNLSFVAESGRDYMRDQRGVDHREIEWEGMKPAEEQWSSMVDFLRLGAIRIDANSGMISMHSRAKVTASQMSVLKDIVRSAGGAFVDLEDDAGNRASMSLEGDKFGKVNGLLTRWASGETPTFEGTTFSVIRPIGDIDSRFTAMFSPFQRSPELRAKLGIAMREKALEVQRNLEPISREFKSRIAKTEAEAEEIRSQQRSAAQLDREQAAREGVEYGKLLEQYFGADTEAKQAELPSNDRSAARSEAKRLASQWRAEQDREQARLKTQEAEARGRLAESHISDTAKSRLQKELERRDNLIGFLRTLDAIQRTLPVEVRGKIGGFVALAELSTPAAMLDEIERRVERIDKELERYLKKEATTQVKKFFKQVNNSKVTKAGEAAKGKSNLPEIYQVMDLAEKAFKSMSAEEGQAEGLKLQGLVDSGAVADDDVAATEMAAELIPLFAGWNGRTEDQVINGKKHRVRVASQSDSAQRFAALEAAKEMWSKGMLEAKMLKAEQKERRDRMRAEGEADIAKASKLKTRDEQDVFSEKRRSIAGKLSLNIMNIDGFFRWHLGDNSNVYRWISDSERKAANAYDDSVRRIATSVDDWFTARAGSRFAGEKLRFKMATTRVMLKPEKGEVRELSQLQMITAKLIWRQDDGKRHMKGRKDENGNIVSDWSYGEKFMQQIDDAMSDEAIVLFDFLSDAYAAEYESINKVYRKLFGINLPKHAFYAPLTMMSEMVKDSGADPVTGFFSGGLSGISGALKSRGTSIAEPDFKDALQTYVSHSMQMEHFKAFAELAREAKAIFGRKSFRDQIKRASGDEGVTVLNGILEQLDKGGIRSAALNLETTKLLENLTGRLSTMILFGKLQTVALNITQMAAAAAEMGPRRYAVQLSKLMFRPSNWIEAFKSDYIQRRIDEMPAIVRQVLDSQKRLGPSRLADINEKLGYGISTTDGFFTAATYAMLYDLKKQEALKLGIPADQIEAFARNEAERITERLAQPTRKGTKSIYENNLGAEGRALFNFISEPRKNAALISYAFAKDPSKIAGTAMFVILNAMIASVIRAAWQDFRDDDEEEDVTIYNPYKLALEIAIDPIYGIPVVGGMIQDLIKASFGFKTFGGTLLEGGENAIPAARRMIALDYDPEEIDRAVSDTNAILGLLGIFDRRFASLTSITNVVEDVAKVYDNLTQE